MAERIKVNTQLFSVSWFPPFPLPGFPRPFPPYYLRPFGLTGARILSMLPLRRRHLVACTPPPLDDATHHDHTVIRSVSCAMHTYRAEKASVKVEQIIVLPAGKIVFCF